MITLPNGVKVPDGSDLTDPQDLLAELATSFSDALGGLGIGKRQPRTYLVANQTEKTALTGLTTLQDGDRVFVADTAWWELRISGAWVVWQTVRSVAWPFAHTGITPGNGSGNFTYTLNGDLVTLHGSFRVGSTTQVTSGVLSLPFPVAAQGTSSLAIGTTTVSLDASLFLHGVVIATPAGSTAGLYYDTGRSDGQLTSLSNSSPVSPWSNGHVIGLNLRWRRTL